MVENAKISTVGLEWEQNRYALSLLESGDIISLYEYLKTQHPADIANFLTMQSSENRKKIVEILSKDFNHLILLSLEANIRQHVIEILGPEISAKLITKLDIDDAIFVLEDLDTHLQNYLLAAMPEHERDILKEILKYPENSAGRIMQKHTAMVLDYWSIDQTMRYLKNSRNLPKEFYEIYVLDDHHRPVGSVPASKILRSNLDMKIGDVMNTEIRPIEVDIHQEEVSYIFKKYEIKSVPVINKFGKMVGLIEVDDIVEVIDEEAEKDILYSAGIKSNDIHASVTSSALNRLPWLVVNLMIASFNSQVIHIFEPVIEKMLLLATVMPIVASIGGNTGTQTVTVIVRAIATKSVTASNLYRIIFKEIGTCLMTGTSLAILGAGSVLLLYHNSAISMVFGLAIFINIMVGGLWGAIVPLGLNKMGADPAIASTIFLTGMTDLVGFFSFLFLANLILIH